MKEQKILNTLEIAEAFNAAKNDARNIYKNSRMDTAFSSLSTALSALQESGIDVSLSLQGQISENAFTMVANTVKDLKNMTVLLNGILHIGSQDRLLCIVTAINDQPVLQLYLSKFDIRQQGALTSSDGTPLIRSIIYDLENDAEALLQLQNHVIVTSAKNDIIRDFDSGQAFDHGEKRIVRLDKAASPQTQKPGAP